MKTKLHLYKNNANSTLKKQLTLITVSVIIMIFTSGYSNPDAVVEDIPDTVAMTGNSGRQASYGDEDYEKQIWDYLVEQYENEYAAAAIMGNSDYETSLCPYRVEGDTIRDENGDYQFSIEYSEKVDKGEISKESFTCTGPNGGGYGLFAWTGIGRKGNLYDFAHEKNCSISDWKMQLDFAYEEIVERYYDLYCILLTAETPNEAANGFATIFERGDTSPLSMEKRKLLSQKYLEKYGSPDYEPKYKKGKLLPVNHSFDYLNETFDSSDGRNIYTYIAQNILEANGYYKLEPSGYFDLFLDEAMKRLCNENNTQYNGKLDPMVWNLIDKRLNNKIKIRFITL